MKLIRKENRLKIILEQDLNLFSSRRIARIASDSDDIQLDLSGARLVDSEGLIALLELIKSGKHIEILNPPFILLEIADLLQLDEIIDIRNHIIYQD